MLQSNLKSDSWEYLFIKIIKHDNLKNLILGNIYRPPKNSNNNDTVSVFNQEFSSLIQEVGRSKSDIILAGDYNIDLLSN